MLEDIENLLAAIYDSLGTALDREFDRVNAIEWKLGMFLHHELVMDTSIEFT